MNQLREGGSRLVAGTMMLGAGLVAAPCELFYPVSSHATVRSFFSRQWQVVRQSSELEQWEQGIFEENPVPESASLAFRARSYGATIGVVVGLATGVAYRTWMEAPLEFKLSHKMCAVPFQLPVLNSINGVMQGFIKGGFKYALPALPLIPIVYGVASRTWTNRNMGLIDGFKCALIEVPGRDVAQAVTLVGLAVLVAVTQTHWVPLVAQLLPIGADPSGHVFMQISLAWSQALANQATGKGHIKTARLCNALSVGLGFANAVFMVNTSSTFHTVREIASGTAIGIGLAALSKYVVSGLPYVSDVATVADGATTIAQSMGHNTAALESGVVPPLFLASLIELPAAIRGAFKRSEESSCINQVIHRIGAVALPLILINMGSGSVLAMLNATQSQYRAPFELMAYWTAKASRVRRLTGILEVQALYNSTTTTERMHHGCKLAATMSAAGALVSSGTALGGALWITHAGCCVLAARYPRKPIEQYQDYAANL